MEVLVWRDGHGEESMESRGLKTTEVDALSSSVSQKEGTRVV